MEPQSSVGVSLDFHCCSNLDFVVVVVVVVVAMNWTRHHDVLGPAGNCIANVRWRYYRSSPCRGKKKKVVFFSFSATVNQLINDGVERLPRTSFAVVFRCCFSVWNATLPSETQLFGSLTFSSAVVFVILPFRNSHRAREFEAESGSLFYKKKTKQTNKLCDSTVQRPFRPSS